jgi:hypothetical protein
MPIFISGEVPNGKTVDNVMGFVKNVTRDQNENIYGIQFEERAGSMDGMKEFVMLAAKIVGGGFAEPHLIPAYRQPPSPNTSRAKAAAIIRTSPAV